MLGDIPAHMDSSVAPSVMPHHTTVCDTCHTWTVLLPHLSRLITQQSAIPALMPNEFLLISYIQIESRFIGIKERWVNDSLPLEVSPGPLYVMSSMSRSWDRSFIGLACGNLSLQMSDSFQVNGAAESNEMSF